MPVTRAQLIKLSLVFPPVATRAKQRRTAHVVALYVKDARRLTRYAPPECVPFCSVDAITRNTASALALVKERKKRY